MEIKDKRHFKILIRAKIDRYINDFPFYFYGNLIINIVLIFTGLMCIPIVFAFANFFFLFGIFMSFIILPITIKGLVNNMKLLKGMIDGQYAFDIESHEMDTAIELIEDLPLKKTEVDKLKISLSFGKIIDVLENCRIIQLENGFYDLDKAFMYKLQAMDEENKDRETARRIHRRKMIRHATARIK